MGRFSGKSSAATRAKRDFIRINPYEIPEKALAVIANICSKNNTDDANPIIQAIRTELQKKGSDGLDFYEFIEENRKELYDFDFLTEIRAKLSNLIQELLAHENTNDTQIVVAGGFSAGKSSFLNALTGAADLLPTGIDPCSMVQTYLYCSAKTNDVVVKAVNLKNAIVQLDKDVLQSIQHESKSKIYLASVLEKLFVEVPSTQLDGFVFIDTPGYNNSEKKNATNNSTDEEVAKDAINRGNVLLWVIDAGAGTIPNRDLEMIRDFINGGDDRKIAVVFNKADKKGESEIKKIVNDAFSMVSNLGNALIDVFGFSSQENRIYYSHRGYDMPRLLSEFKRSGSGNSGVERCTNQILDLFDEEISFACMAKNEYQKGKTDWISQKNEAFKRYKDEADGTKTYVESLTAIMVDSYDTVLEAAGGLEDNERDILKRLSTSLSKIYDEESCKAFSHDSVLNMISRSQNALDKFIDKHNKLIDYSYYLKDYREEWVEKIKVQLDRVDENLKDRYQWLEEQVDSSNQEINKFNCIASRMDKYRDTVKAVLNYKIREFRSTAHKVQDARLDFGQTTDVFTAIRTGSYSDFLNCFVAGVKLSDFNSEGYSPLTYAVRMNKYDMVKFLIDNGAAPELSDRRGMNAFHTAVENANGPMVTYFAKLDSSLTDSRSDKGESASAIADKYGLGKWYQTNINR